MCDKYGVGRLLAVLLLLWAVGCTWSLRWNVTVHSEGDVRSELVVAEEVE